MLSKEDRKLYNAQFWNEFKNFIQKFPSSEGKRIKWLSYPTHIKFVYLRLEATNSYVAVNFDIQPTDEGIRQIFWAQLLELKRVLTDAMQGDSGNWIENESSTALPNFSRIQWKLENVNYFELNDKPKIFAFYKSKLLAFDEFYNNFGEILTLLAK